MAIQLRASSSFSSSPSTPSRRHDVFLSFRGDDTRDGFTGHLYNSLVRWGIQTFIDNDLSRGEQISQALLQAIAESKLSIIVFSENYASSKWCLDELVHILECNQKVRPVFYKVDPSDVRHQRGKFGEAFATVERRFKDDMDKVSRWRAALSEAANLSGWFFSGGYEFELIDTIVEEISKIFPPYLDMPKCQVGLDRQVKHLLEMLDVGGSDVRMVGIWGTGRIGKTTIAKAVYNEIAHNFDGCCFLDNVREGSGNYGGLVNLQTIILSKIVGPNGLAINNVHEGITLLGKNLRHKRILLIVDDVDSLDQLKKLAGNTDWFGRGSRVIITTRDKHLLTIRKVELIYEVPGLCLQEALKLFRVNALLDIENLDADEPLVEEIVSYAQGIPLALEVLGSHLSGTSVQKWRARMDGFRKDPPKNIQDVLLISFNSLPDTVQKVFLDIACLFKGWKRNDVIQILEGCDRIDPEHAIEVLEQKALISTGGYGDGIHMHDLLEEMGKAKVMQESGEAGERSRLWHYKDVQDVLAKNKGTRKIEGIIVKMPTAEEIRLSPQCFKKMENLKIFININGRFVGKVKYYPSQLRVLHWPQCPLECLPSDFDMRKMVHLNMSESRITRLGKGFKNLKSLKLSGCTFLTQIPDISGSPNLDHLDLEYCTSLEKVHPSVGDLEKLVQLNLRYCENLVELPGKVKWRSLENINLYKCYKVESFPEIVGEMKCMTSLSLSYTGIKTLPSSIRNLINLEELWVDSCENLTNVPSSIYELQKLRNIQLRDCTKLVTFPTKVDSYEATVYSLDLSGSPIVTLPECIKQFVNLSSLDLSGCRWLVEIPDLPPTVRELDANNCVSLERVSKLSNILERKESQMIKWMDLTNCWRLSQNLLANEMVASKKEDDDLIDLFSRLLCSQVSEFTIIFPVPRSEVPKWFSCQMDFIGHRRFEFWIEALPNFKWDNTGLVLCVAFDQNINVSDLGCGFLVRIYIEEVIAFDSSEYFVGSEEWDHVWLRYIPFAEFWGRLGYSCPLPPFTCRVVIHQQYGANYFKSLVLPLNEQYGANYFKSCGVHLVMPPNEDVCMKLIRSENLSSQLF